MPIYDNHDLLIQRLETVQGNEKDQRQLSRDCTDFVTKVNGQWEDSIYSKFRALNRPRYTFDRTNIVVKQIVGELNKSEFGATVAPAGGQSTKKVAEVYNGMVRAIQNWSGAEHIYKKVAKKCVVSGFDAVRIKHDYRDSDSFNQDLEIEYITNAIDSVWFDDNSEKQDRSDAEWVITLKGLTKHAYDEQFPDGSGQSVDTSRTSSSYYDKKEVVTVGEILYKKYKTKALVQMSNGAVYEDDEKFQTIKDELALVGVTEVKRRERKVPQVYSRFFDGKEFLGKESQTAFKMLPIAPFYHGFEVVDDKIIWERVVGDLMDAQRVFNYAESKMIEEGALSGRRKIFMTGKQAKGHQKKLATLNTNSDPVQFWNYVENEPLPFEMGGATIDQSLLSVSQNAANNIEAISGMFGANLAKQSPNQSGVAAEVQLDKGNTGNVSFYADIAVGITYLCQVLVDTIPTVYDTAQKFSVIKPDGQREEIQINSFVADEQTGQQVPLNNLNEGSYAVTCEMGAMFKNQLDQANAAMLEASRALPEVMSNSADIFLRNIQAPNMDQVADRARAALFKSGQIPIDQMTDEEKAITQQQAEAGQQPDPLEVQTMRTLQATEAESVSKAQANEMNSQAKIMDQMNKAREQDREDAQAQADLINTMADTLNKIKDAMGVDAIVGPSNQAAYIGQAEELQETISSEPNPL